MFDKEIINIPCEVCGAEIPKTIGWLERNKQLTCKCGTVLRLNKKNTLKDIAKVEDAIKKISDNIVIKI